MMLLRENAPPETAAPSGLQRLGYILRPENGWTWVLTVTATLGFLTMALAAYCMIQPVAYDGIGQLGAFALHYPLHSLVAVVGVVGLWFIARRSNAMIAVWLSGASALITAAMVLVPSVALIQASFHYHAPLSLGEYLVNSGRMNAGDPRPDRTVTYGTAADGAELKLDVWLSGRPRTGPPRPAVVLVHGGGWSDGSRSMMPEWNRWLNELGYEVFDVEYRMPPPARWLEEVGDVKAALGWLVECAQEYHVDPARISLMGGSAGANLSMLAAYSMGDVRLTPSTTAAPVKVRCVINLYGPSELTSFYRESPDQEYVHGLLDAYIGGSPDQHNDRYALLSPLSHVDREAAPTMIILGSSDRLVNSSQAQMLAQALAGAGVSQELVLLPAADHGFDINWGGFATQIARFKIQEFLAKHAAS